METKVMNYWEMYEEYAFPITNGVNFTRETKPFWEEMVSFFNSLPVFKTAQVQVTKNCAGSPCDPVYIDMSMRIISVDDDARLKEITANLILPKDYFDEK